MIYSGTNAAEPKRHVSREQEQNDDIKGDRISCSPNFVVSGEFRRLGRPCTSELNRVSTDITLRKIG